MTNHDEQSPIPSLYGLCNELESSGFSDVDIIDSLAALAIDSSIHTRGAKATAGWLLALADQVAATAAKSH